MRGRRSLLLKAPLLVLALLAAALLIGCTDRPRASVPLATPSSQATSGAVESAAAESTPTPASFEASAPRRPSSTQTRADATPRFPSQTPGSEPTAQPTPAPPSVREIGPLTAYTVTPAVAYSAPSSTSAVVRELSTQSAVTLVAEVQGENWIVAGQGWVHNEQGWERTWYQLDDGSYVYRAFVFVPDSNGLPGARGSDERYVIVSLEQQTAWAMQGSTVVRTMPVTTGKGTFPTPTGTFRVLDGGRLANTRMTSRNAGITDPSEQYDVANVLYTQYFRAGGFALHMNYWQPNGVFGGTPTSHGCVGFLLPDAQFLWMFGHSGMRVVVRESGVATPEPPTDPTPTLTPAASGPRLVEIYATQGGRPGEAAVAAAKTTPGATCTLQYISTSGSRRELPELAPQIANADGWLEWHWLIPADETPGTASIEVTCPGGAPAIAQVPVT